MANFGYKAKSIISGVSTLPYALRDDGQMVDTSENCMLSTKFGLCKRPGSTYVQTIESNLDTDSAVFFPILTATESEERVVFGSGDQYWHVHSKDGVKYPVTFFPSSADSSATAVSKYVAAGATFTPTLTSTTSIGDIVFIADSQVTPRMKETTWGGYTETVDWRGLGTNYDITNDDVFSIWVRNIVMTTATIQSHTTAISFRKLSDDTITTKNAWMDTIYHGTTSAGGGNEYWRHGSYNNRCRPDSDKVAAGISYQISEFDVPVGTTHAGPNCEATNLNINSYAYPQAEWSLGGREGAVSASSEGGDRTGVSSVIGRLIKTDEYEINSISVSGSDAGDSYWGSVGWGSVGTISDLPPNSFEDHTLKVGLHSEESLGGFYMRYVADDEIIEEFGNNHGGFPSFTNCTKVPRRGHWEEYCGTGVKQEIDGTTMPLLFVTRPDDSYALMEARESFFVNEDYPGVDFESGGWGTGSTFYLDNFDAGFNNDSTHSPLVVNDSIEFSFIPTNLENNSDGQISSDTKLYIHSATWVETGHPWQDPIPGRWEYELKTSKTSTSAITWDLDWSDGLWDTGDTKVKLTTYDKFAWQKRVAGDESTNPVPGFIDTSIKSLFNYQDRLGMVTAGEVIFSGTGDYFNFFKTTVRDLDASDPFSAAPNLEDGDELKFAVPFERDLMLISTRAQYTMRAPEGLSPLTASVLNAARIETDNLGGVPAIVGDNVYVSSSQEDASTITALRSADQANTKVYGFDASKDTPGYLPQGPRKIVGNQKHDMLFFLDDVNNTDIYVYSWLDTKEGRPHSAWNKWTFGADYVIKDLLVHGDRLYLLVVTLGMTVLEYIDLDLTTQDSLLGTSLKSNFNNCLIDHKTHNTVATEDEYGTHGGIYSETIEGDDTKIKLKWKLTENNKANVVVVKSDGTIYEYDTAETAADGTISVNLLSVGDTLEHGVTESVTMTELVVNGVNLSSSDYYVGLKYTMNAVYGPFIPTVEDNPVSGRNIFAKSGRLTYSQTNEFKISVDHDRTYTQTVSAGSLTGTKVGDTMFAIRKHLPDIEFTVTNEKPWNTMFQILKYDFTVQEIAGG